MLTRTGAKLLDFGLAERHKTGVQTTIAASAPSPTESLTMAGTFVGTLQYASPEQLQGRDADVRSDIFAFGVVLYEMATGRRAFDGSSPASIIAAVLDREPEPVTAVRTAAPAALHRIVTTCLAKDPDDRWGSIHDVFLELKWLQQERASTTSPTVPPVSRKARSPLVWSGALALLVLALAILAVRMPRPGNSETPAVPIRFTVTLPAGTSLRPDGAVEFDGPVVSPDGRSIVFSAARDGKRSLWLRPLDSTTAQPMAGTDGGFLPFWSPDSRDIAFFTGTGELKRTSVGAGASLALNLSRGRSGAWSPDGVILLGGGGIKRTSESRPEAQVVIAPDAARGHYSYEKPQFLPDGRHFLFYAWSVRPAQQGVFCGSLDSPEIRPVLVPSHSPAMYSPSGHLLFLRGQALVAQPFDPKSLRFTGEAKTVADAVACFSTSDNGMLVWRGADTGNAGRLIWFDRSGKQLHTVGTPLAVYANPALSPDEKRVAVGVLDEKTKTNDLWMIDLVRHNMSRFTFDPGEETNPAWSPDGSLIAYTGTPNGVRDLFIQPANGTGNPEPLLISPHDKSVQEWSPDGKSILFAVIAANARTPAIWHLPVAGHRKPAPVLQASFYINHGQVSPDGRWLAYRSNESGRFEIYVQNYPVSRGKWQISNSGGQEPRWRKDGKELFYVAGGKLMAAQIRSVGDTLQAGIPEALFEPPFIRMSGRNRYCVAAGGQRFLVVSEVKQDEEPQLSVLANWPAMLTR
jgi:Tol biopolymer transport system component